MNFWDTIKEQELNGACNCCDVPKWQLIDFAGVGLGIYFVYLSRKLLINNKKDNVAIIGLILAGIMIYVHSLKFFNGEKITEFQKNI